mgnify:CR=1 FL=1
MANAIKKISVARGYDVTRYTLQCFGGAGGQHACLVADELGMETVFIHPYAGVLSAYGMGLADIRATRQLCSDFIGARADEIALLGPTSLGLSLFANGIEWRRDDEVIFYQGDYPANVYPWMAMANRGVEVRFLNTRGLGRIRLIDVLGQIDEQTRLVALASCHFVSGFRLEVDALGRELRSRGILFCVDAIQTLGAFPTTVENVDFLAADAHKWLLGPCAAGILFVSQRRLDLVRPIVLGWHNVKCPNFIAQDEIEFRPDARRFEAGTHTLVLSTEGATGNVHADAFQLILAD